MNSLKLSFTSIECFHSNFVVCESFRESNSPDILAICEAKLDDSIYSGNFYVRGYIPLIRKDSNTHMHGLAVHVKGGIPFPRDLSLGNSADCYLCFQLVLLHSVSYFFFLYQSPSSSLFTVFDSISSNIEEVLSVNPSANVFVFGDFNVLLRTGLPILVEVIDLMNSVIIFLISNDLTKMVNFTWISDCDSHSPVLLDLFISSDASICSTMAFPQLRNSDHVVISVSIYFPSNSQRDASFHRIAYDYSRADWDSIRDHLRDVAASEFCKLIYVEIPHFKYQVKPNSSPWFSATCTATPVHRIHFFVCTNRVNLLNLKSSSDRLVIIAKGFLKLSKLHMLIKQKKSITSQKLGFEDFWRIANSVLNKGKSTVPPLFNSMQVLSSASNRAKLFAENFSKNSNLDDSGIFSPVFSSKTNLKLHNISVTPKMVNKVITNLGI